MDLVVDCGGVGYAVSVPLSTLDTVPAIGENVTLRTVMVVREDAYMLYGFATEGEREAFRMLTNIQGIGGRTALGILSSTTLSDLQRAVLQNNLPALMRLPGIGRKTAERLVVELRDKVTGLIVEGGSGSAPTLSQATDDAISALQALGFARAAAEKAVKNVLAANPSIANSSEDLIRHALRATQ
jgi:Holliday junction DNA helicase RuvA